MRMHTASVPRVEIGAIRDEEAFVVRPSPAHGLGVFATRDVLAGTRVAEYTGDRISHAQAAERYDDERDEQVHTLLFTVDRTTVIDGATGDGIARYVNHSCEPNCDAFLEDGRIYLETIRPVAAGTELTFDYRLRRPRPLPADWRRRYACRCGAPRCRGTMLVRPPRRRRSSSRSGRSAR
jgi:hypothetical protein